MNSTATANAQHYDLVIIGAGIAGLAAGRAAQDSGKSVLLVDKGRRIGGRVSTRRADGFVFNHGAQFLTARDPEFAAVCQSAIKDNALAAWQLGARDAFVGAPFMRALPMFMGTGLAIQQECEIATITADGDVISFANANGVVATAARAIISAPAPQAAKLVAEVAPELVDTANAASYAPCWTALFGFDTLPANIPDDVYQAAPGTADVIGWAGWEHQRPVAGSDGKYALTIQASPAWSRAHIEQDRSDNLTALRAAYEEIASVSLGTPAYAAAHRWLYAKVETAAPAEMKRVSDCGRVAIAGDWLGGPRIEHAYLSGKAAAAMIG